MRRALFVHQNYPAQFRNLAPSLAQQGWDVRALKQAQNRSDSIAIIEGVTVYGWAAERGTTLMAHPWVQDMETKLIRAEAAAVTCERLKKQGWQPDLIIGHPGWGEMLFIRHIWPDVPQIHYLEFHYAAKGLDVGFDPEFPVRDWRSAARVTAKAAPSLLSLEEMDAGLSPTYFQANTYPSWSRKRISVIHDGIDTDLVAPQAQASLCLKNQDLELRLKAGDPVITFINRNLEPYRGYHRFIRALPAIQKNCPDVFTLIIGGDGVSYGAAPENGTTWKQIFLNEVANELDLSRVIFMGNVDYATYLRVLQISACHIYLTYPFVLGWSCIEALAAGALVVGSATEPVEEVISDGENGILVDFFDSGSLVESVSDTILNPGRYTGLRSSARQRARETYDLRSVCLPKQLELVDSLSSF